MHLTIEIEHSDNTDAGNRASVANYYADLIAKAEGGWTRFKVYVEGELYGDRFSEDFKLEDIAVVSLPGSKTWESGWGWGAELEEAFPGQDGYDFALACAHNDFGPAAEHQITNLLMVKQGAGDEGEWIWLVQFDDGSTWRATGWCDYTGWDCQSNLTWEVAR